MLPGLVLAGQLGLMWGAGAFLGPVLLGNPADHTLSVEVHRQALEYGRWPRSAADAVLLLAGVGVALGAYSTLTRRMRS
jgi:ABC-type spermidine/putrescine transport system permease subunit I